MTREGRVAQVNPDLLHVRAFVSGAAGPGPIATSPLLVALGTELLGYDTARKELVIRYTPGELFRQGAGMIQGGAVAAMLDFAMALAGMAACEDGTSITTTMMNTSFLLPAGGTVYEARGRIFRQGRRVMFAQAELSDGGRVVASATSSLLVI